MEIRIAVLIREHDPLSLMRYRESVMQELKAQGVLFLPFKAGEPVPTKCNIAWDPGMGRNRLPLPAFRSLACPVVVTLHGSATFTMKWREVYPDLFEAIRDKWTNIEAMREWRWFRKNLSAVIAVSQYGAQEASLVYDLPSGLVTPIYHGVDHTIFFPKRDTSKHSEPYLLHVSAFQPKKNVDRLFAAYAELPRSTRPRLVAVVPGYSHSHNKKSGLSGLAVIDHALSSHDLAQLYRSALAFVFPSLHETFGLPIIEAMACGCPVVTSFDTACAEVAGNAALLVNPRSTREITEAMSRLINEPDLREQLRQKGLSRAKQFSWAGTARKHMDVFRNSLQ